MDTIILDIEGKPVSSVWRFPEGYLPGEDDGIIIAHGAGSGMDSPFLSYMHERLGAGMLSVKFNFPYMEQGRKAPDRQQTLEGAWRALIARVRNDRLAPRRLMLAGKSMGGRMASMVAAGGDPCDGLVFFGYPLHPAGKPDRLRFEHLPSIGRPMLFIQGSRDPLCRLDILQSLLPQLSPFATLHVVEGGDHSFKVPKSQGRSQTEVWEEIVRVTRDWMSHL